MIKSRYMTAAEAAKALDISPTTLYAYVSRGLIRSEELDNRKRTKRYHAEDINKLKQKREHRKNPKQAIRKALHWGTPVLESALTLIADNQLYYRGYNVTELARTCSLEHVAHLLWSGGPDTTPNLFGRHPTPLPRTCLDIMAGLPTMTPMERMQILLPAAATSDLKAYDLTAQQVKTTGAQILGMLAAFATNAAEYQPDPAQTLAQWTPNNPLSRQLLTQALILSADHELNVSAFTARCTASALATPYQVVSAGLAALSGARHGRESSQFEAMLAQIRDPADARGAVIQRLGTGERIPGFDHYLYPEGDPRGAAILDMIRTHLPDAAKLPTINTIVDMVAEAKGHHPNLDAGLGSLAACLNLPTGAAVTLFAIGRTIGWIAHALETYAEDDMIRPRATYIGPKPRPLP